VERDHGGKPLRRLLASSLGLYWRGSPANPKPFENDSQLGVARPAIPQEVFRLAILLVAVQVAHFHVLRREDSRNVKMGCPGSPTPLFLSP
jgi:hypothetical protein